LKAREHSQSRGGATRAANLSFGSIEQLSHLLARRKISPVELAKHFLARIEQHNPALHAYLTVVRESALAAAERSEKRHRAGHSLGPLDGIPIALKDNIWTRGIRTTAGSKFLGNFVPETDATVAAKLARAGAVLLGKTNLHEFAYGITTGNPHYGAAHNPWDLKCIPGGSSGGSAAAVTGGLCVASVGTDTGGSIRIPAALCGVVGLKPTFGRVSVYGTVPLCPSLDHIGPLAHTVGDAALIFSAIAGRDPLDVTSHSQPRFKPFTNVRDLSSRLKPRFTKKRPLRLGLPKKYFFEGLSDEVRKSVAAAARSYERLGAIVKEVSLPHISDGDAASTSIALAEAINVHQSAGWFPAHAHDYSDDVRKRLEMGREIRAVDYLAAQETRKRVRADFEAVLTEVDAILAPTVPIPAPRIGENTVQIDSKDETVRSALIRLNRPANFTGSPAISLPCGFTENGLPIGLQLIGRAWGEEELLMIALLFEQAHPDLRRHPTGF
jgi:aspartyl-tRNA(Asn)/glutamyl-tRNA(Gln) amidotransferase subunit A